ncbi:MAG: universal stress protein [Spirulinaceae cyanobacterium]
MGLKTIIVAIDSSERSRHEVVAALKAFYIQPITKIIFSHVSPTLNFADEDAYKPHQSQEETHRQLEGEIKSYQDQLGGKCELEIVSGDPAEEIVRLANIYDADLIVIGNRGLKGFKRVIKGSVSSQVVSDGPCSVLVVKAT